MSDLKNHCWKHESWSKDCFDCHQFHKIAKQAAEIERLQIECQDRIAEASYACAELEACRKSLDEAQYDVRCMTGELERVNKYHRAILQSSREQVERMRDAIEGAVKYLDALITCGGCGPQSYEYPEPHEPECEMRTSLRKALSPDGRPSEMQESE